MENEIIATAIIGIFICVMGILNMCGYISTLHRHHRHRVSEEDRKPFGRLVGIGTLIIGIGMLLFALCNFLAERAADTALSNVGAGLLIAAFVAGLVLSFYAMIKYNHGIF